MVSTGVRWWWWAAAVGVWAAAVGVAEGTGMVDMDRCKNGCSAVPEDMWPYCCESHRTCCQEFANSCVHDCLPRVHTGDLSVVEERPGLCCALYNLCCFRETLRISSNRNKKEEPVDFPIFHRFHVNPLQSQATRITMPGLVTRSQAETRKSSSQAAPSTRNNPSSLRRSDPRRPQKKTVTRPQFQRPQPPKKSSAPRLPQRPQFLKKSHMIQKLDQPVEEKTVQSGLDSTDLQAEAAKTEPVETEEPQETEKATEDQDGNEEGLQGQKKPKSGPRLSSLLLGGRKEVTGAQEEEEARKEIDDHPGVTQRPASVPVVEKRKSISREPSTAGVPQQRGERRRPNTSQQPKVTRKRFRGSVGTNQRQAGKENTGRVHRQQERRGRPQGAPKRQVGRPLPERQNRPQVPGSQFGRTPAPAVSRTQFGRTPAPAEERLPDQPRVSAQTPTSEGRVSVQDPVAQGKTEGRPRITEIDSVDRLQVDEESLKQPHTEATPSRLSTVAEEVKLPSPPGQVEVTQFDQPQAEGKTPQVSAIRTGGRSLIADERVINRPQAAAEKVTSHLHVAVEKGHR
ncbi:LOW QUALITY PROTEIN: uncharacterized protein [Panulirus ornatus]|uniref:LOW QUALITY PROTEIN: uncharacterized protein n=1 Tax=Panulirus ornatus TaxID=150431 RepID=UPI003A878608